MPAMAQVAIDIGPEVRVAPEVREYVVREGRSSVRVDDEIVVGYALPETVDVYEIEDVPTGYAYRYAVVNDRRVIVEPQTRRVIQILD
jgi:hypothetical protein